MFHCKRLIFGQPGVRVDDIYEVAGQAIKSLQWCGQTRLTSQIFERIDKKPERLTEGSIASMRRFFSNNSPAGSKYDICMVPPGG